MPGRRSAVRRRTTLCLAGVLAAASLIAGPVAAAASDAPAPAASMSPTPATCRVVLGGGLADAMLPGTDPDFWNRINFSYYDAAQYALSQSGSEAEGLFSVVGADKGVRTPDDALAKAVAAGCREVVRVSVFGDDTVAPVEVVFRIAAFPVVRDAGSAPRLGAPTYQHEDRYPVNEDVTREVRLSRLAERAVSGYLEAVGAAR